MNIRRLGKVLGSVTLGVLMFSQTVFANAYGNVNVATLNIRKGPGTDQKIIGSVGTSDYIHILNKAADGWYAIETDTDELGYISGQYVDIQKAKGVINANGVNVRSTADYSGSVISQVYKNNIVYAYAQVGDWFLIQNGDQEGYIHREFVDGLLIDQLPNKKAAAPKKAQGVSTSSNSGSSKGSDVVAYAKQFLGNPYVYGGNSLTKGVDCSGFTTQVFKNFGVSLSRSSSAQYANDGYHVGASDIQVGDLIFYGNGGNVSHVGIYMGNNQIIHSSTVRTGITTGVAFRTSGKPLIGIKRVL